MNCKGVEMICQNINKVGMTAKTNVNVYKDLHLHTNDREHAWINFHQCSYANHECHAVDSCVASPLQHHVQLVQRSHCVKRFVPS